MNKTRKIVKIFLASPGDLSPERIVARNIVDQFNNDWADHFGIQIELVGWEDTLEGYGRPQALINKDLDECEFFVGVIWKRWGTAPDIKGPFTSGFEEEFVRSVNRREAEGTVPLQRQ